ncbi:MAG TPA: tetratricopeptide repeat-containing glycosyltransferase family protein [Stellaceae bacterium]|nr:tetratricopeptide repeat-containing glycosyltransferase family protein [Stellaceae bacterium]
MSLDAGQFDHAVQWIARALKQDARAEFLFSLGTALRRQERHDEALLAFQHTLKLAPGHWDAAQESGALLYRSGRLEEALGYLEPCLQRRPSDAATLVMCTDCMFSLRRFEQVAAINQRAHAHDPGNADPCNSVGVALQLLGRQEDALPWFDRAIGLRPDFVDALNNKAVALSGIHRFDEACAAYERVKTIDPGNVGAEWNLALLQMLMGNFEAGWAGREARWKNQPGTYPKFAEPRWFGEANIEGKTILVCADEGLGDTIQFARYVPEIAARGARVILAVEESARALLSGLPGVAQCVRKSAEGLPAFDMHCPMSGLPLAFGTRLDSIPSARSYLPAAPDHLAQAWQTRLGPRDRLRVGLVWSGNPQHVNDHNRSIQLRSLLPLFDVDATFVSLQKDPRPPDRALLAERSDIVDLTAHLTDFVETAALIGCLDLVITVDTSVAHLSAALGCPTWILLPYTPDYRWLLDRDDNPWYPTARLFRQTESREYGSVLARMAAELRTLIPAK